MKKCLKAPGSFLVVDFQVEINKNQTAIFLGPGHRMSCGGTATIKPQIRRLQVPTDSEGEVKMSQEKTSQV